MEEFTLFTNSNESNSNSIAKKDNMFEFSMKNEESKHLS